jgi:Tol biopolymer transport system component
VAAASAAAVTLLACAGVYVAKRPRGARERLPSEAAPTASGPSTGSAGFHPKNPRRVTFGEGCQEFPEFFPDSHTFAFDGTIGPNSFIFVQGIDDESPRRITDVKGWDMAPAVSPDGQRIAFSRLSNGQAATFVVDRDGRAPPHQVALGRFRPTWSRDNRSIWAPNMNSIRRIDADSGAVLQTIPAPPDARIWHVMESDAGLVLEMAKGGVSAAAGMSVFGGDATLGLALLDPSGALRWLTRGDTSEAVALVPRSPHLIASDFSTAADGELFDIPLDASPPTPLVSAIHPHKGIAISPDARHIAWSTCDSRIRLAWVDENGGEQPFEPWHWNELSAAWIPGTHEVVVLSSRSGKQGLWVARLGYDEAPRAIPTNGLTPTRITVSDDGAWIAFSCGEGGIHVVPVAGDAPPRAVTSSQRDFDPSFVRASHDLLYETVGNDGRMQLMRVSADGATRIVIVRGGARHPVSSPVDARIVYFAGDNESDLVPMVFHPETGRSTPLSTALRPAAYNDAHFSPDGRRVYVLLTASELLELDVATGNVVRRVRLVDDLSEIFTVGERLAAVAHVWTGDIWVADDPF